MHFCATTSSEQSERKAPAFSLLATFAIPSKRSSEIRLGKADTSDDRRGAPGRMSEGQVLGVVRSTEVMVVGGWWVWVCFEDVSD
eukprot:CAMPEP_0174884752 /NCGR_PEP_ID=MMETSP0167-20121228/179_1 /TAXON_ID=38298 /ORGANISM="Rhodella maculata, Strain CCMP736" /LENGTH=84 /DNA_ID=CAMNT_0016120189 /DNA_START=316 /DNA_END=567 /DNA_ORIENTATION=-